MSLPQEGVQAEIGQRSPPGSYLVTFLEKLVTPFLAWQAYYDFYSCAPPWGERSHAEKGILEFYAELLGDFADPALLGFMGLLARKNEPKGHEPVRAVQERNCGIVTKTLSVSPVPVSRGRMWNLILDHTEKRPRRELNADAYPRGLQENCILHEFLDRDDWIRTRRTAELARDV